ncbi:MAG: KEOPS complex subunit Pcc1 [Candidatus Methanoperedens sp.]|nr:KEOPS complex subunit Pcc1 [Candidatus Methanoperedens sp.]
MKIKGKLIFKGEGAEELINAITRTLAPDNVPEMETHIEGDFATVGFEGDKVGTVLSSVDDYLMNAKIAYDILLQKY